MRTLIISDLHLGDGGAYEVFAGGEALPALLDSFVSPPTRVFVNGDGIDFLMNEDPLELDPVRAAVQARAIVAGGATAAVLRAFGRILGGGGEVTIRLGNHDVELALPEVQAVVRGALGQPEAVAGRLAFQLGEAPEVLEVGGARVLVTHGEHGDPWNQVDYKDLVQKVASFRYAPGSLLVKQFLNPLTRELRMRFANLLKPDFQGGTLTALAVNPTAVKLLFQKASVSLVWQLFKRQDQAPSFAAEDDVGDLGLAGRVDAAGLSDEEREALAGLLGDSIPSFAAGEDDGDGPLGRARLKMARAGLALYAGLQRKLTGTAGDAYFALEPDEAEWKDALRLAGKFNAGAVIIGHTHAARWKEAEGIVFANTGTWIWLMKLPSADAGDEEWTDFLAELQNNPALDPQKQKLARTLSRFTAALVDEIPGGGASLSLVEWDGRELTTLGSSRVKPAAAG